jgi:hypothetical protein
MDSHFDKSRWLIGGDLLTDPDTSDDQLDGGLINKSFSALPTIFVIRTAGGKIPLLLS